MGRRPRAASRPCGRGSGPPRRAGSTSWRGSAPRRRGSRCGSGGRRTTAPMPGRSWRPSAAARSGRCRRMSRGHLDPLALGPRDRARRGAAGGPSRGRSGWRGSARKSSPPAEPGADRSRPFSPVERQRLRALYKSDLERIAEAHPDALMHFEPEGARRLSRRGPEETVPDERSFRTFQRGLTREGQSFRCIQRLDYRRTRADGTASERIGAPAPRALRDRSRRSCRSPGTPGCSSRRRDPRPGGGSRSRSRR